MSVQIEIHGRIVIIFEEKWLTEKFRKRRFKVLVENKKNPDYHNIYQLELAQDRCDKADDFKAGDDVVCFCGVTGRDWYDKEGNPITDKEGLVINSTTIECWHIRTKEKHAERIREGEDKKESKEIKKEAKKEEKQESVTGNVYQKDNIDLTDEFPDSEELDENKSEENIESDDLPF
jgi:hypothetical protein